MKLTHLPTQTCAAELVCRRIGRGGCALPGLAHSLQGELEIKHTHTQTISMTLTNSPAPITIITKCFSMWPCGFHLVLDLDYQKSASCTGRHGDDVTAQSVSPLLCVTEAKVTQSCSSSSLGRWSMDVLRGRMERGFFFFSRLESRNTNRDTHNHSVTHTASKISCVKFKDTHIPGLSLPFAAAKDFLCVSKVAETKHSSFVKF